MVFYTFLNEASSRGEERGFAYGLLYFALAERFGIRDGVIEKVENGKPYLKNYSGIKFNISHCRGLAVCSVSEGETGVDAELIRGFREGAMRRIFSPAEIELVRLSENPGEDFFRLWTLKESLCKNTGKGIFSGLSGYEFVFCGDSISCAQMPEKAFTQRILEKKWVVSVCGERLENEFVFVDSNAVRPFFYTDR